MGKGEEVIITRSDESRPSSLSGKFNLKPNMIRKELSVFLGEFIGTFMFLFFAFAGAQVALDATSLHLLTPDEDSRPEVSKLLYVAFSFGISLAVNVAIFADISGGMFNPAVTAALYTTGTIRWQRAIHTVFAQLLASIISAFTVEALFPRPLPVATTLDPSMSVVRGFFLEIFLTAQLVLAILMVPAGASKPAYCGMALFIGHIVGAYFTGCSMNPARSFGPAIVVGFQSSDWIYWFGPLVGGGLGAGVFEGIKSIRGENLAL